MITQTETAPPVGSSALLGFRVMARIRRDGQTYKRDGHAMNGVWKHFGGDARRYRAAYIQDCEERGETVLSISVRTWKMPKPNDPSSATKASREDAP